MIEMFGGRIHNPYCVGCMWIEKNLFGFAVLAWIDVADVFHMYWGCTCVTLRTILVSFLSAPAFWLVPRSSDVDFFGQVDTSVECFRTARSKRRFLWRILGKDTRLRQPPTLTSRLDTCFCLSFYLSHRRSFFLPFVPKFNNIVANWIKSENEASISPYSCLLSFRGQCFPAKPNQEECCCYQACLSKGCRFP